MDKVLAKRLVAETLENPFKKEDFVRLSKEICKKYDESKAFAYYGTYVAEIFRQYVKGYERIATYTDPEDKKIDVLIVYLQKDSSLERARTAQRNFIARYLKDRNEKDAAIVAFVSPDVSDWRFSFVKMEYRLEKTEKGRLKTKEEFTPARRYSFLVGAQENSHTAQSRLLPLLLEDKHPPLLGEVEDAFSIEKVTDEFFEKYRNLFLEVRDALDGIISKDQKVKSEFEYRHVDPADFVKKLLGQIVFLYFLQKKGWFGVERDAHWGTGPKNFLRKLFNKDVVGYVNFFNDVLEPLFYEALARERDSNFYKQFNCKIPFLNGGLFDPINNYNWVHTDITLPNELFVNTHKTSEGDIGTGILDIFDRYNFTVKEDEPLEKEVAIDPEMLGKVFEKLLEVKDRQSKGAYYTPREVVHYMCQESLIYYLTTELGEKTSNDDISTFIQYGETALEHEARVEEKGRETKDYSYKLPASIRENAVLLDSKLASVKVCDPAVGSGAFLVGMMSEIVRARRTLTIYLQGKSSRTPYEFKRHAIHDSLYGVDLDPAAVEIAKLRLWLSLVVDENDIQNVKPLPNLDYKIMQGNSLIEEYEGVKLFDESFIIGAESDKEQIDSLNTEILKAQHEYINLLSFNSDTSNTTKIKKLELENKLKQLKKTKDRLESGKDTPEGLLLFDEMNQARRKVLELQKLHLDFFEASQKSRKDDIRKQINNLEWELIESTLKEEGKTSSLKTLAGYRQANMRPFFLWKLHFSDVFRDNNGFNIVIANPPYLHSGKIIHLKPSLKIEFGDFYSGVADLYTFFIKKGVDLTTPTGCLCYITSNKYMRAGYGKNTRLLLTDKATLLRIIDFGELPVFEAATDPAIILASKIKSLHAEVPVITIKNVEEIYRITDVVKERSFLMPIRALSPDGWVLENQVVLKVKEKLKQNGVSLNTFIHGGIYYGIKTGFNKAFIIDDATRKELIAKDSKSKDLIKPWLDGHEILRWGADWSNQYLIKIESSNNVAWPWAKADSVKKAFIIFQEHYPAISAFLNEHKEKLIAREDQGVFWWELRSCAYMDSFKKTKILYNETSKELHAFIDDKGYYINKTGFFILTEDNEYLLGVLNSKLLDWYYRVDFPTYGDPWRGGRIQFRKEPNMFNVPVASPSAAKKEPIISRVKEILAKPESPDVARLEKEIDAFVYELYDLTQEEIQVIEAFGK